MSAGSAYNLLHQYLVRGGWGQPATDSRQVIDALTSAAKSFGAEIRTGAEVERITVEDYRATGVLLASGERLSAASVLSSVDPKQTFLSLVTPEPLDPEFVWQAQTIKMRGVTAKLQLTLDPSIHIHALFQSSASESASSATYIIAPSLTYLERAYDAAKYGQISENPCLEVTISENVLTIHAQFVPYFLKNDSWKFETRVKLETLIVETLEPYVPNLKSQIQNLKSLTPLDLETTFSLTEGDPHHGQLALDQFFFMRPIPGYANQKTPIAGLYLCGSGVHGGGGVSGIPGRNAAKAVK
jgi:phytoene dehydrogenase-like protein